MKFENANQPVFSTEQYECPCCEGAIPNHLVFSRFDFNNASAIPAIRTVSVHCVHCNKYFSRQFELRGAVWSPVGDVEQVKDARKIASLSNRVNKVLNAQLAMSA